MAITTIAAIKGNRPFERGGTMVGAEILVGAGDATVAGALVGCCALAAMTVASCCAPTGSRLGVIFSGPPTNVCSKSAAPTALLQFLLPPPHPPSPSPPPHPSPRCLT